MEPTERKLKEELSLEEKRARRRQSKNEYKQRLREKRRKDQCPTVVECFEWAFDHAGDEALGTPAQETLRKLFKEDAVEFLRQWRQHKEPKRAVMARDALEGREARPAAEAPCVPDEGEERVLETIRRLRERMKS